VLRGEKPLALSPDSFAELLQSVQGRITKLTTINANIDLSQIQARIVELGADTTTQVDADWEEDQSVQDAEYEEL